MTVKTLCAIFLILSAFAPARAEDATLTPVEKEKQTLESFAAANRTCREWSDRCAVCARHDDGTFACSLPGIACEPAVVTCRNVAQDTTTEGKPAPPAKEPDSKTPEPAAPPK